MWRARRRDTPRKPRNPGVDRQDIPHVAVRRLPDGIHYEITCPYCGRIHWHDIGAGDDPNEGLGHRLSHCVGQPCHPGYILVKPR